MYVLSDIPQSIELMNGSTATPVASLRDEYGGVSHIIIDDHCYVLVNGEDNGPYGTSSHWYKEAVQLLRTLPDPI